ncbi:MAG: flagellar FlbD family protein [Candidatus Wallbacteria bacterium]
MIKLRRLNKTEFMLNPDLIVQAEAMPDTVIVLTDGTKYVVADSLDEIYSKIVNYRSDILFSYKKKLKSSN